MDFIVTIAVEEEKKPNTRILQSNILDNKQKQSETVKGEREREASYISDVDSLMSGIVVTAEVRPVINIIFIIAAIILAI